MLPPASVSMIAVNGVFWVLAALSVVVRLYVRRRQRVAGLVADDWLIFVALFFSTCLVITNIVGVPIGGFGLPFATLSEEKAETFLKIMFVLQFWYLLAVAFVKFSILCLYGRLFSAGRFPIVIKTLLGLTTAWLISFLFATFFQVWPIRCNWIVCDPTTNYTVMYMCSSITDIILDITILCLPAFFISKLHLSSAQKRGLVGIFGLGVFCIVASIARLVYAVKYVQVNITGNYAINFDGAVVNMIMWSGIEACISTVCGNLPCYGPLLRKAGDQSQSGRITGSFRSAFSGLSFSRNRSNKHASFEKPSDRSTSTESIIEDSNRVRGSYVPYGGKTKTSIRGGMFDMQETSLADDIELQGIRVETSMRVGGTHV